MGMYVKMDARNRVTLPKEAAELFENAIVNVKREKNRVVLEPVKEPFKDIVGLVKTSRPFSEIRREMDREMKEGSLVL